MNNVEFENTFDEIEYDIAMKMYWKHNSKIASINDHLGEIYDYKDLEEAEALEEYDTLQEYKKALKEKCDAFDKAIKLLEELISDTKGIINAYNYEDKEETIKRYIEDLETDIKHYEHLLDILGVKDNENESDI